MKQTGESDNPTVRERCTVQRIPGAGSNRRYFILGKEGGKSRVVVTYGDNPRENMAFMALSEKLSECQGVNVPEVKNCSKDLKRYSQTYVGQLSLFDYLEEARRTGVFQPRHINKLKEAIELIASIHRADFATFDKTKFYPKSKMDLRMVRYDLNYFKYCFLKPSGIEFDEDLLQDDFDRLEAILMKGEPQWRSFMYRDFQSRNVMISDADGSLYGIDFQGGRIGPSEYDLASFLWQAKAAYPQGLKDELLEHYLKFRKATDKGFDAEDFARNFPYFVLFRVMQTLGAYGFRGWVERKPHFLGSIKAGTRNLKEISSQPDLKEAFPYIHTLSTSLFEKHNDDYSDRK